MERGMCYQEPIEQAKPAREHVTTIDSKIQTWRPDANFRNNQIWKGSSTSMQTGICRVLRCSQTASRSFNSILQQPMHRRRQRGDELLSRLYHSSVQLTRNLEDWSIHTSLLSIRSTLTQSNTPKWCDVTWLELHD